MREKRYKLLELFAGSKSISREAEKRGYISFCVDWVAYDKIDLICDIGQLTLNDIPFVPDIVWASPDCTTYSIAACSIHRNRDKTPKSEYAIKCDEVNQHWIKLIKEWLLLNPNLVFFIENPRGNLRHMEWMQEFERKTVWYCQYGDDRAKPTDIWTNCREWIPKPECRNYRYDKYGNIINKHCHHESARRGSKTGTQGRNSSYERSKIPNDLCIEILNSFEKSISKSPVKNAVIQGKWADAHRFDIYNKLKTQIKSDKVFLIDDEIIINEVKSVK